MKHSNQVLSEQIEQLVREHWQATQQATSAAMARAFSSVPASQQVASGSSVRRASAPRRTEAELAALGEQLYEAVAASPGETMSVLAPTVGQTPRALARPMARLKSAGRVRSVGQKHLTRYFPAAPGAAKGAS